MVRGADAFAEIGLALFLYEWRMVILFFNLGSVECHSDFGSVKLKNLNSLVMKKKQRDGTDCKKLFSSFMLRSGANLSGPFGGEWFSRAMMILAKTKRVSSRRFHNLVATTCPKQKYLQNKPTSATTVVQAVAHHYVLYRQASVFLRLVSSQHSAAFQRYRSGRDYRRSRDGRNAQQKQGSSTSPITRDPPPGRPSLLHLCSERTKTKTR